MKNTFWSFFAGFFQDQSSGAENGGSRKALALYVLLFFMWELVKAAAQGVIISPIAWYCVVGLLAWTLGAITSETIMKYLNNKPPLIPPAQ